MDNHEICCGICQNSLDDSATFTLPVCQHKFHTNCLFENFCRGNITCAICRSLPINNLNVDNTLDNITQSYEETNEMDEARFFRNGLAKGRKANCKSKKLKKAVFRYDAFLSRIKKKEEKERKRKIVRKQFVQDCKVAIEKVLKLKRYENLKLENNKNTFAYDIRGYKSSAVSPYTKKRKLKKLKSRIAQAFGFKPLTVEK